MVGYFKDVFFNVPILALLAIITPIVLKYIYKLLKLRFLIRIYWESLNKPNIIYMVRKISKSKYENLAFLVPDSGKAGIIPKIIIFINDIENAQRIAVYLYLKLLLKL